MRFMTLRDAPKRYKTWCALLCTCWSKMDTKVWTMYITLDSRGNSRDKKWRFYLANLLCSWHLKSSLNSRSHGHLQHEEYHFKGQQITNLCPLCIENLRNCNTKLQKWHTKSWPFYRIYSLWIRPNFWLQSEQIFDT